MSTSHVRNIDSLEAFHGGLIRLSSDWQKALEEIRMLVQRADEHFSADMPDFAGKFSFTNVTEAYALLALLGEPTFTIMEKVTPLDLLSPDRRPPFMVMGPVLHVRSQVAVLAGQNDRSAVLVGCPRGYGQSMADSLLHAGKEYGLRPGGENLFAAWMATSGEPAVRGGFNVFINPFGVL